MGQNNNNSQSKLLSPYRGGGFTDLPLLVHFSVTWFVLALVGCVSLDDDGGEVMATCNHHQLVELHLV